MRKQDLCLNIEMGNTRLVNKVVQHKVRVTLVAGLALGLSGCIQMVGEVHKEFHANGQLNQVRWETAKSKASTKYDNYLLKVYYNDGTLKVYKRFRGRVKGETGFPDQAKTKIFDEDGDLKHITVYRGGKLVKKR